MTTRKDKAQAGAQVTIDARVNSASPGTVQGGGDSEQTPGFHQRIQPEDHTRKMARVRRRLSANMVFVALMTVGTNILILAVPIYLFQISNRVLTSRSTDTLAMLTIVVVGAIAVQSALDAPVASC